MRVSIIQTIESGVTNINGPLSPIINTGTRAAPTIIWIPYLSPNPGICFFNNASCSVGTTMISQIHNRQTHFIEHFLRVKQNRIMYVVKIASYHRVWMI